MRFSIAILLALSLSPAAACAQSVDPTYAANQKIVFPPPPTHYTSVTTPFGFLLDDPAARAILDKVIPGLVENPAMSKARGLSLKTIQAYSEGKITDAMLAQADAEFAQIPMKE